MPSVEAVAGQSRQNSLLSTSCITMETLPPPPVRAAGRAPAWPRSSTRRAHSASSGEAISAFQSGSDPDIEMHPVLDGLASGTRWKNSCPDPSGSTQANAILLVGGEVRD